MRLHTIAAAALAATAVAGTAFAGSSGSWGSGNGQANGHPLICLRTTTTKTVTVRGARFYPGELTKVNKPTARDLVAAKKAAELDEKAWKGHKVCLIDANGRAIPDTPGDAPPPPPPVVNAPPPPPPVVTPPPPVKPTPPPPPSNVNDDRDDDDEDGNSGSGNDEDNEGPPPGDEGEPG